MAELRAVLRSFGSTGAASNARLALRQREVEDFLVASLTRRIALRDARALPAAPAKRTTAA